MGLGKVLESGDTSSNDTSQPAPALSTSRRSLKCRNEGNSSPTSA